MFINFNYKIKYEFIKKFNIFEIYKIKNKKQLFIFLRNIKI